MMIHVLRHALPCTYKEIYQDTCNKKDTVVIIILNKKPIILLRSLTTSFPILGYYCQHYCVNYHNVTLLGNTQQYKNTTGI